jgi:hypothetical protein
MCEVKTNRNVDIIMKTLREENSRYLRYKELQASFSDGHQTIQNTARKAFTDGDPETPDFVGAVKSYENDRENMLSILSAEDRAIIEAAGL